MFEISEINVIPFKIYFTNSKSIPMHAFNIYTYINIYDICKDFVEILGFNSTEKQGLQRHILDFLPHFPLSKQ